MPKVDEAGRSVVGPVGKVMAPVPGIIGLDAKETVGFPDPSPFAILI
jgi:hypothetical protein